MDVEMQPVDKLPACVWFMQLYLENIAHRFIAQVQELVKSNMHFVSETTEMLLGVENVSTSNDGDKNNNNANENTNTNDETAINTRERKILGSAGKGDEDKCYNVTNLFFILALSQVPLVEEDFKVDKKLFPENKFDVHDQQVFVWVLWRLFTFPWRLTYDKRIAG